jgi:hypothetical protein
LGRTVRCPTCRTHYHPGDSNMTDPDQATYARWRVELSWTSCAAVPARAIMFYLTDRIPAHVGVGGVIGFLECVLYFSSPHVWNLQTPLS